MQLFEQIFVVNRKLVSSFEFWKNILESKNCLNNIV